MAMAMAMAMAAAEEETVDWSELPYNLLDLIMDSLSSAISDYITFGTVCVSWRSAYNLHTPRLLPLLMVPPSFSTLFNPLGSEDCILSNNNKKYKKQSKKDLKLRRFYNISDAKVDDRLKVRMPQNRHCRGSSHGWLITIDGNKSLSKTERSKRNKSSFSIRLFNPFLSSSLRKGTNETVHDYANILLPSFESSFSVYSEFEKAVLSADPISNPTDYMVMAIYSSSRELAFHKPGDKSWTAIKSPSIKHCRDGRFSDLIYYEGKFFVLHRWGAVVVCDDVAEGAMAARVLLRSPITEPTAATKYLVESSEGDLLQVHRSYMVDKTYSTIGFTVFKLLLTHSTTNKVHELAAEEDYEWVEVKNLYGEAMFLGQNASISISAIDYPGCKSNCIYYTDDKDFCIDDSKYGQHDMGVFNLEDGSFKRYFPVDPKDTSSVLIRPNPIWVQPTLPKKCRSI